MTDRLATESSTPIGLRAPRWLGWLFLACAWAATLVMALGVVLRLEWHDGTLALVWINAFTVYFYLPAYACLAWAVWQRRWWLAAVNVMIVGFHLSWIGPELMPISKRPSAMPSAAASPTLRIFYGNVLSSNTDYDGMLKEIAIADPDLIFLNEFSDAWRKAFAQSPVMQPFLQTGGLSRNRIGDMGFYARVPVSDVRIYWAEGRLSCGLDVTLGQQEMRMLCLHAPRPFDYRIIDYYRYWAAIQDLVKQQQRPLIVIGDFNATQFSQAYQMLLSDHLRSAHLEVGRGYATTWPNGYYLIPPIRIDHALLSPRIDCLRIVEGQGTGSDHRPLILDVQLRPAD